MEKLTIIHTEWSDAWGGQEIRIITESLALKERFNTQIIIACKKGSKIGENAIKNGLEVAYFDFKSSFDLKSIFALVKFIKTRKIDILNSHSGKDTWVGGLAAKIAGIKFIRTRHLSNKINPSRLNFINSLADFIITTGESVRLAMINENRINPNKILSIPTGIDDTIFNPDKYDKTSCKNEFAFDNDKIYVGILAVLRSFKRHDIFLKIALKIHANFPNAVFIIAGEGPQRTQIEAFIKSNNMDEYVKMLGHINHTPQFLKAIDIFMMTSDSKEGVPQSLMQALLMQKPCIATNVGSISDLYDKYNFSLVKFDDNELEKALVILLKSQEKREILSKNARKFVQNNFSKNIMSEKIYDIYQRI
ncbi:MAG: glycosyltransferase [Campylobacter sp.]